MNNNPNLYANGTAFDQLELLDRNIKNCLIRLKDRQPIVIIIDGGQSTGKTTLSISLADRFNYLIGQPEVALEQKDNVQYAFGGEQLIKKLPLCQDQNKVIIVYDESGDYNRKGALSRFNKTMDRAMDMVRIFQVAIIIVCHDFTKLPREIIDKKIATMLIHCTQRTPGKPYATAKVYDYTGMCWIQHYKKQEVVPEQSYIKVYPNFYFRFKDLHPTRSNQLHELGGTKKIELFKQTEVKMAGLITFKEIGYKIGMSEAWVKSQVRRLKIKEESIYKKRKYFNPRISDMLFKKIKK
jgi:hypothetical protein